MRGFIMCTVLGCSLVACGAPPPPRYLNADELAMKPNVAPESAPCNELEQQGPEIELKGSRGPAPTPAGGTIEDGTYVLTSSTLHTKDGSDDGARLVGMGKITMQVSGSTSQVVRNTVNGRERRTTVQRESNGKVTKLRTICASPTASNLDEKAEVNYTATSSSLQYITPGPAGTVVVTYTKVPNPKAASRSSTTPGRTGS